MKFTVQRSRWYRGQGGSGSKLALEDGTMCCLGFLGRDCNIPGEALLNVGTPDLVPTKEVEKWPEGLVARMGDVKHTPLPVTTATGTQIIRVNDATYLTDDRREKELVRLFKQIDVDVEFVP